MSRGHDVAELPAEMELTVLSHYSLVVLYGLAGGAPGPCGRNRVERACGAVHEMGGQDHCPVEPGDVLVLGTPSGGWVWCTGRARR